MKRKALLSVVLSAVMIIGSVSPAFAAGQVSSNELTAQIEASEPESQNEVVPDNSGRNDNGEDLGQESVDEQETAEEGKVGAEAETEETGIGEENPEGDGINTDKEKSADEDKKDPVEEEEGKTETLVGAEGERVSVGENVTAEFDSQTGTVTFYSQGGTLSGDWFSKLGISSSAVKVIIVSDDSDMMYFPENSSFLFSNFYYLKSVDFSKVDTSNVTNMSGMFSGCRNLQTLDLSKFDTSIVTIMSSMFSGCNSLQALDLSGFNTSNVTSMEWMFSSCRNLQTLDLSGFDTSNVTDMSLLFNGCNNLQTLDVSGFDTSNVTEMELTFSGCNSLRVLDVSGFNTSNVTDMSLLFNGCNSLRILDVSGFDTSNVTTMRWMFDGCSGLRTLDVSGFNTSNVTDMSSMFSGCNSLRTLDVNGFNTSNVTNMDYMFSECTSLQALDVSGFETSNATISYMFSECSSLQALDVSGFDTSNITNMSEMFSGCSNLQTLDVSGFNTSNTTDMSGMFSGCSSLQTLDLSGFNTSNTTDMSRMFSGCSSLQTLDLSGFNTLNTTDMSGMFSGCGSIQTLNVSGFDTSNVRNMSEMFYECSSLQELGVQNFDISNVDTMDRLFLGCPSLQRLDLSLFDMEWVKSTEDMLSIGDSNLLVILTPINVQETIYLPYTFVDSSGTEYNSLPEGLSESIRLTKKGADIPVDLEILGLSDDCYGANGTQASFHIDAQGSGTVSYQWQYKLAGSNEWNTSGQASAKTADYAFELQPSYDNMQVRCIISDEYGFEVISETRNVNVFALTSQPTDAVAADGQTVTFNVTAIGQGLKYQWYYKRPNASWRKVIVAGYNASSLPITGGEKNNGTSYRCVISDSVGNSITSSSAKITVVETLQITDLSEDFYGKVGTNASFHIDAVGKGNLTYQWQYKLAGETRWRTPALASAKTTDYVFKLRTSYENIQVRCIVKDEAGNTCTSDVRKANVFAVTQQPDHVFAELGENVTFSVDGIGQNLTYQWYYRRLDGGWKKVSAAGYNTASLTITAQVKNNGNQYRCYVYDGLGNLIKSQAAMLIERNEEYEG